MKSGWLFLLMAMWVAVQTARADEAHDSYVTVLDYARARIHTLSRPVHLFHWTDSFYAASPALQPMDARIKDYARYLKESFWTGTGGGNIGPGFYLAVEPIASRSYGTTLLQVVVPENTRLLDLSDHPGSDALAHAMSSSGCMASSLYEMFTIAPRSLPCKTLRNRLVQDLDVQGLRYDWSSSTPFLCHGEAPYAFVLIDDRAVLYDRIVAFRPDETLPPEDGHNENRLILSSIAKRISGSPFWEEPLDAQPKTDVDAWMRENLVGCGSYPEDKFTP